MRSFIAFFVLFYSFSAVFAQPQAKNFPDMVVYRADAADPYLEVWYTASMRKLESGIEATFKGNEGKDLVLKKDSSGYTMSDIIQPVLTAGNYTLKMEIIEGEKRGMLIRFRFASEVPAFDLLNPQLGIFRSLAEALQDIIDEVQQPAFYDEDQLANIMYLFTPKESEKNLSSYLFMYSREPKDTTMKKLIEWMVFACEKNRTGNWINDSTFRVDDLRQPAFGYNESFSITIVHSVVQGGYHQYELYLSNYIRPGNENNNQVRPYDIHKRLWRYYNTLLFIEKYERR